MLTRKQQIIGKMLIAASLIAFLLMSTVGTLRSIENFNNYKQQFMENLNNL